MDAGSPDYIVRLFARKNANILAEIIDVDDLLKRFIPTPTLNWIPKTLLHNLTLQQQLIAIYQINEFASKTVTT